MTTKTQDTETVKLEHADRALYNAGRLIGIYQAKESLAAQLTRWCATANLKRMRKAEAEQLRTVIAELQSTGTQSQRDAMTEMGVAIRLGAGRPRARTLRERVQGAMMGAITGWRGAPWQDDS
jgi:hypothetical protein